jgi:hypothetical protein
MPKIRGYEVAYKHRGSWRACRRLKGQVVDEVPVAWDTDWTAGKPPSLVIWFQDPFEAKARLDAGEPFVGAVAKKRPGSASSEDINGLFEAMPTEAIPDPNRPQNGAAGGVRCSIVGVCKHADDL